MTFSILVDIFYPSIGTVFSKEGVEPREEQEKLGRFPLFRNALDPPHSSGPASSSH
jgi:hypothetical protein